MVTATAPDLQTRVALRVRGASKTFPGVRALSDFDIDVAAGSVHALLGHNGCGKSTLIKALAGVHHPDPGAQAWIDGEELSMGDPVDATNKGLRFVHQELGVIPEMGAVDNVGFVLGFEKTGFGAINWRKQTERTVELLERFGFKIDPWKPLAEATPPERAAVAIVRAVAGWQAGKGVLILDEPTAALPAHEVDELFKLIRQVSATGTAVILVSHRLDEVMAIADHATVMRSGSKIWEGALQDITLGGLVDLIANTEGEEREDAALQAFPVRDRRGEPNALEVNGVHGRYLRGVSLNVRRGEVVGLAGLLGSGREELPYLVAGNLRADMHGSLKVGEVETTSLTVQKAREMGVALVPADRGGEGIFAHFTTRENVSLAALPQLGGNGVFTPAAERSFAGKWLRSVHADASYTERLISTLSGGNQQKAIIARWLCVSPTVLCLSEPTAGVDIGARNVIYEELRRRAAEGLAILMASSDIEDLLASCDRVIVLRDGLIAGEFAGDQMTKPAIAYAMEGAHRDQH